MPLPEALAAGVPVVASDLAVYREIAGDIPDYADPLDDARWEALVRDYASATSPLRDAQLLRMRAFVPPTWEAHFAIVDALIAEFDAGS
jgi:glycosyltransferase involved in cell wall biosynthesis